MAAGAQPFTPADGDSQLYPRLEAQIDRAIEPLAKRLKTFEGSQPFTPADGDSQLYPWLKAQIDRAIEPLAKRLKTAEDENAHLTRVVVAVKTMLTSMNNQAHLHEYEVLDARAHLQTDVYGRSSHNKFPKSILNAHVCAHDVKKWDNVFAYDGIRPGSSEVGRRLVANKPIGGQV